MGHPGGRAPAAAPGALAHDGDAGAGGGARRADRGPRPGGLPDHLAGPGDGRLRRLGRRRGRRPRAGGPHRGDPRRVAAHRAARGGGQQRDRVRRGTRHGIRPAVPRRTRAAERAHRRGQRRGVALHGGDRPAAAMTQAPPARQGLPWQAGLAALRDALGLFTILPVGAAPQTGRREAARAVLWLPVAGALLAVPAAGVLLAVEAGGHSAPRRLLAAALAIGVLALLTGGLHLDGLADTADGLGSRRPREEALAIMRRSDIGPFGVVALIFAVLIQITALATVSPGWPAAAAVAAAAVTGRVAVVLATGPGSPAARPGGFGALVAGATTARARVMAAALLLALVSGAAALAWGPFAALRGAAAVLAGLLAADVLRRIAKRRLGGMTGDVFGALIEVSATTVLLVLALAT